MFSKVRAITWPVVACFGGLKISINTMRFRTMRKIIIEMTTVFLWIRLLFFLAIVLLGIFIFYSFVFVSFVDGLC